MEIDWKSIAMELFEAVRNMDNWSTEKAIDYMIEEKERVIKKYEKELYGPEDIDE